MIDCGLAILIRFLQSEIIRSNRYLSSDPSAFRSFFGSVQSYDEEMDFLVNGVQHVVLVV